MKAILEYWRGLKAQEQQLLMVAGGFFVIFVFIMGVWRPLNNAIDTKTKSLEKQQALAVWMQTSIAKIKAASPNGGASSGNLSQVVNSTRNRFDVSISKMQPKDNTLRLTIDLIEFNKLVGWLTLLTQQHNIKIQNIDVNKDATEGFVKVSRLVLEK